MEVAFLVEDLLEEERVVKHVLERVLRKLLRGDLHRWRKH